MATSNFFEVPLEFHGGSNWKLWGVRLFFGPPGYTNGIACSSTHPLERPPLICSPFEFATVQVYGFWAFACFFTPPGYTNGITCVATADLFEAPFELRGGSNGGGV